MRFLDANIFLRYLIEPRTRQDTVSHRACTRLFASLRASDLQITTSETILHEVFYVLCSRAVYGLSHADAVDRMTPVLALRGFQLPNRRVTERAVQLFAEHSHLDFSDVLSIAHCEADGHELVSFDKGFDKVPGVVRTQP